jgi:hypothetical protein
LFPKVCDALAIVKPGKRLEKACVQMQVLIRKRSCRGWSVRSLIFFMGLVAFRLLKRSRRCAHL